MLEERVAKINKVVKEYFDKHGNEAIIPAKDLMPEFIEAGIYEKEYRNGLPIRNDLRKLDKREELHRIPFVHPERKKVNTSWYFVKDPEARPEPVTARKQITRTSKATKKTDGKRNDSDESYILDLCDKVLGLKGSRQHRFDFLRGDLSPNTGRRVKLPCDSYYSELDLVVEYNELQHTESVKHFDKPDKKTISGVHRGEQRRRYDERRRKVLPEHGIQVIDFHYSDFEHKTNGRLERNRVKDEEVLQKRLNKQKNK